VAYQSLVHRVGSPPVIGILSFESLSTAGEEMGNPTNPAFMLDIFLRYGNHMTFYERLQNTLFWLWIRSVNLLINPSLYYSYNPNDQTYCCVQIFLFMTVNTHNYLLFCMSTLDVYNRRISTGFESIDSSGTA
jgi:hypothetical protein